MKENLFQLIRDEEVVLWAGAGLSLYAGYPSGSTLAELVFKKLSRKDQEVIDSNLLLPDLAEEIFRIRGNSKNYLIRILKEIFLDQSPSSTEYHDKLKSIPHFKTIITTNYDKLFEVSYNSDLQLIIENNHVPYLEKNKAHLFKIHGDLSSPDSVIITRSDYNKFFEQKIEDNIIWSVIKERISTNSILFLGYNLEDPNVSVVFDRITSILGSNRKECFLVAPNLPSHKVSNLIKRDIQYINATAENLINEIHENLKENIIGDLESGKTSADTFRKFLANNDLLPELKASNDSYQLKSIKGTHEGVYGKFNLTLKNDKDFLSEFSDYVTGKKIGTFEVSEDNLLNADFWYGGLKFPDSEGIAKLEFRSTPKITTSIDLKFDDGFELNNIPTKLFGSPSIIEIHLDFPNGLLRVNLDISSLPNTKFKFDYVHSPTCTKVKEEIELMTLLNKLGNGEKFMIYPKDGQPFSKEIPPLTPFLKESKALLEYFTLLKSVENHYNVRFQNFARDSITDQTFNKLQLAISCMKKESIIYDWDNELEMEFIDEEKAKLNSDLLSESGTPIVAVHQQEEILELHGCEINLGFKRVEFDQPYISNLNSIQNGNEKIARVRSKNKKMIISYSDKP